MRVVLLGNGAAGAENQCIALAEALGVPFEMWRVQRRGVLRSFLPPPSILVNVDRVLPEFSLFTLQSPSSSEEGFSPFAFFPPFPDLLIASGRATVDAAVAIRRASRGMTFTVQIQEPRVNPSLFDVIVTPKHDYPDEMAPAPHYILTDGSLSRVNPTTLTRARIQWQSTFEALPHPRIGVLVGGHSSRFRMTDTFAETFANTLRALVEHEQCGSLLVTMSRRTPRPVESLLRNVLAQASNVFVWDGSGENPYMGLLACADAIIVTADSVNMVTEACGTGVPVFTAGSELVTGKLMQFHAILQQRGLTKPFVETFLASWTPCPSHTEPLPLQGTAFVATEVIRRLRHRHCVCGV